ncbi:hypothetical protein [Kamptonema sp. UHCC 0994]|uniref:heterocyst-inhibiting protein PatX n=1 Tax=Kamptonema sp. UHCC 0994 TaxID=3031329 RepID=UPI0023B94F76|nr:hypothetical protein [Kamptonema sp. UHCC 0994]MDF0555384.1 hypothetical protein [Kamptonema sp. UHCC 0994]
MRFYTSILLSSLLLIGTAVRGQSFEPVSSSSSDSKAVPELLAAQADNYTVQANNDNDVSPERGSGR